MVMVLAVDREHPVSIREIGKYIIRQVRRILIQMVGVRMKMAAVVVMDHEDW